MSGGVDKDRGEITILVDGDELTVPAGVSIAAALLLHGIDALRMSPARREPRGVFCGMGSCQECVVAVDGADGVRSCITPTSDGMQIRTGRSAEDES